MDGVVRETTLARTASASREAHSSGPVLRYLQEDEHKQQQLHAEYRRRHPMCRLGHVAGRCACCTAALPRSEQALLVVPQW